MEHLNQKISIVYKGIGILRKLGKFLPRKSLVTIYKSFIRAHLDYCDVIYDKPNNASFTEKIEKLQYDAALAITGCIRGTLKEKLYKELGLKYLRWMKITKDGWRNSAYFIKSILVNHLLTYIM